MNIFNVITFLGCLLMVDGIMAKEVQVKVEGIEPSKGGNIILFVFAKAGFPKNHEQALQQITVQADAGKMAFSFTTKLDEIALKVLHDADENGKVTKNWTGIFPAEGLGFSNDQKIGLTGPPSYKESKVALAEPLTQFTLNMRYP